MIVLKACQSTRPSARLSSGYAPPAQASLRELRHDAVKAALEPEDDAPPARQVRPL